MFGSRYKGIKDILSSIISEVVKGTSQPLIESRQHSYQQPQIDYEAKQKAEKEDALFKEEMAVLEEQKKHAIEKEEKRRKRAKEQKEKLMKWKQEQLAELDNLLNA